MENPAREILNGGVYAQKVRCGKSNCRCARDEPHIAYYFFSRWRGKLTKTYIRKAELEQFLAIVSQAAEERNHRQQMRKADLELLKRLRQNLRDRDSIIKLQKGE